MTSDGSTHDMLDLYLDDMLDADARCRFEERLKADPALRQALQAQRHIDEVLRRRFDEGSVPEAVERLARHPDPQTGVEAVVVTGRAHRLLTAKVRPWIAVAALLLIALTSWYLIGPPLSTEGDRGVSGEMATRPFEGPKLSLLAHYQAKVDEGFNAYWSCPAPRFTETYRRRLGQALRLASMSEGVEVLGLAYSHTLTPMTLCLFARVDGQPAIVYADRSAVGDEDQPSLTGDSGLYLHRREIGELVLYEIAARPSPALLPLFEAVSK